MNDCCVLSLSSPLVFIARFYFVVVAAVRFLFAICLTMKLYLSLLLPIVLGFSPAVVVNRPLSALRAEIAPGVSFDTVAREWRCKWDDENDKASLVEAQKALESVLSEIKSVDGVKGVERIVCGGCLDLKVIVSLEADKFGDWESKEFAPEASFLEKLKSIEGISQVETQTFTVSETSAFACI